MRLGLVGSVILILLVLAALHYGARGGLPGLSTLAGATGIGG